MNPFEDLIKELGAKMGLSLMVDAKQACRLKIEEGFYVQIDLDRNGDHILVGSILGELKQGSYRNEILKQALRVNGTAIIPRGILAFSARNDSLILFQYFTLMYSKGESLYNFIKIFIAHARLWRESLLREEIPYLQEEGAL